MRLLIIRTSAMGDVALTVPVIKGLVKKYPEIEVLLLTRPVFKPFFSSVKNTSIIEADFKGLHKGLMGLIRLSQQLKRTGKIDKVIDIHDVTRSKILRLLFRLTGSSVFVIDKGRKEKRQLIKGKIRGPLKHSVERYMDVFDEAGFPVEIMNGPSIIPGLEAIERADRILSGSGGLKVGIAPYAKHELKMWSEENMINLLNLILRNNDVRFFLMGGGPTEEVMLGSFAARVPGSVIMAGKMPLEDELALISRLDFMISMDSSNMHMAALTGIRVVSIWGATHPGAGFGALHQPEEYSVQIPDSELTCRPCTVYGSGVCRRRDLACLSMLTPEMVFDKLVKMGFVS